MSDYKYTYSLDQFLNNKVDIEKLSDEVTASNIVIAIDYINSNSTVCDFYFMAYLSLADEATLSGVVAAHDGIPYKVSDAISVNIAYADAHIGVDISDELRDRSGKLRVHQTSRKIGTITNWVGEGDDPSDPTAVGGGTLFGFNYYKGQEDPLILYMDFNCVENETWIHEGYVTWKNGYLDTLDLALVPRVTPTVVSSGTNYTLYNGYLIVPTYPGTGNIEITSDLTDHTGGLIYMPIDDIGNRVPSFWNATWNTVTKRYDNIAPAYDGKGEFNLFATEIEFAHFVRKMPILDAGFIALNSSDTDQIGHGMRVKMTADTNTSVSGIGDHDWSVAVTLCMHRYTTV